MARQILTREEPNVATESLASEANSSKENSEIGQINDGVIISANEMEKLLHEWDINGNNDLCVNLTLAERIRQYLAYQEEMDPLKKQMAERIYAPYKMSGQGSNLTKVYVNNKYIGEMNIFIACGTYRVICINDFKNILIALGNQYAPWIDEDGSMDLKGYILSVGGDYNFNHADDKLVITI